MVTKFSAQELSQFFFKLGLSTVARFFSSFKIKGVSRQRLAKGKLICTHRITWIEWSVFEVACNGADATAWFPMIARYLVETMAFGTRQLVPLSISQHNRFNQLPSVTWHKTARRKLGLASHMQLCTSPEGSVQRQSTSYNTWNVHCCGEEKLQTRDRYLIKNSYLDNKKIQVIYMNKGINQIN